MNNPHIVRKTTSPSSAPPEAGIHWINTVTNEEYFSVGTSSVNDWIKRGATSFADSIQTTCHNNTGVTIPAFSVVYINGSQGSLPTIALAQANSEEASNKTYGVTIGPIANNSAGTVVAFGLVQNVNTSAYPQGSILWLSATTPGGVALTRPTQPNHGVFIGFVTRSHPTLGRVEVKIQNGQELYELHDVLITTPTNNQVLKYNSSTSLWNNGTLTKSDVGLGNVDNTSDLNKPISTATQTALNSKQDTITGAASTVVSSNLNANKVVISSPSGKIDDSIFLAVNENLDQKKLIFGEDALYQYGSDIDAPIDDGSIIEYGTGYAYPPDTQYHELEVYQYWILNGQKVVSHFGSGYVYLEADGSDDYQIQWQWTDNVAPDGYYLVKYDNSPNSGSYYAEIVGNTKNFLEDFNDWSTLNPYSGFPSDPTLVVYGSGYAYPADTQYHYIEVRAFRLVSGNKLYGNSQYFEAYPDGSDDYNIQWAWFPVPNVDGYVVTKYDDTWTGQYSVEVLTNSFLEDFTDWSTKDATPNFIGSRQEAEYVFTPFEGIKSTSNSENRFLLDFNGVFLNGVTNNRILNNNLNRISATNFEADGNIFSGIGSSTFQAKSIGTVANANFQSGEPLSSQTNSGNLILQTLPTFSTSEFSGSGTSGNLVIKTGNGGTVSRPSSGANGGGSSGSLTISTGNGGDAFNSTTQNYGGNAAYYLSILAGNGGNGSANATASGEGGLGGSVQISCGSGGSVTSSTPNRVGTGGRAGDLVTFSGNGGSLSQVHGVGGNGGGMYFIAGQGGGSAHSGNGGENRGGNAGLLEFNVYSGGSASGSTIANHGGNAGLIVFRISNGGDGNSTQGGAGTIFFRIDRPGKNSSDSSQGTPGNIIFQPSPAAYSGAAEGVVGIATNTSGTKIGKVAVGHVSPSALLDVKGDCKLGNGGSVFQSVVSNTQTLNFPSIAANSIQELTMTVTGAQVGASVHLGAPSTLEANLIAFGFVSATNTVKIRLQNSSGSAIDPASATWRATVFNF